MIAMPQFMIQKQQYINLTMMYEFEKFSVQIMSLISMFLKNSICDFALTTYVHSSVATYY